MPGNYTITDRSDNENIDRQKYLADHQQHVDNLEPPKIDDYSGSVPQMQTVTDPGEVGSESRPTSLAGELERLRFAIKEMKGTAQWYESVAVSLRGLLEPGDIKPTYRTTASPGWLMCDGAAVSRTTFAALFAVLGTTHGAGDGANTFNVPDHRGRSPIGAGIGPGLSINYPVGARFGEEFHTLTGTEMPNHNPPVFDPGHAHNAGKNQGILTPGGGVDLLAATGPVAGWDTGASGTGISLGAAGGNGAHNTVHPVIACNWMIKT